MTFRIGIISDTHGLLRPEAERGLAGVDHIIHAGDIGDSAILKQLAEIAPVTAIRGNVDREAWARKIPSTNVLEAGGISIGFEARSCGIWRGCLGAHPCVQGGNEERGAVFQSRKRGAAEISLAGNRRATEGKGRQSLRRDRRGL